MPLVAVMLVFVGSLKYDLVPEAVTPMLCARHHGTWQRPASNATPHEALIIRALPSAKVPNTLPVQQPRREGFVRGRKEHAPPSSARATVFHCAIHDASGSRYREAAAPELPRATITTRRRKSLQIRWR